jgi:hypothetical protein
MNVKLKMSVLASALALAGAGQAFATTTDLYLTVDDTTTQQIYTRDLGVDVSTFLSGITGSGTTLAAASVGNMSFAADANLTSFLSGHTSDAIIWNVTADEVGAMSPNTEAVIATSTAATLPTTQLNGSIGNATGALNVYYSGSIAYQANGLTSGTTAETSALQSAYQSANGYLKLSPTYTNLGSGMDMFYITPSGTTTIGKANGVVFGGANADVWTLGSNGTLTVASTIAAVPEASEWMLMLSGFGLIGFIASRRRNSGGPVSFA